MNRKAARCSLFLCAALALAAPACLPADDSAASIAAGGLVPRRETRIVMAKEVLRISPERIIVDYDFRNDSPEAVTTEVAFPIPPYGNGPISPLISSASFSDFKLFINETLVPYDSEAKATLNGKDVTAILTQNNIDIATFGHYIFSRTGSDDHSPDLDRLPKSEQDRLVGLGLYEPDAGARWGNWQVHLQYHWTQTFPAHSTTHIRHEYAPVEGGQFVGLDTIQLSLSGSSNLHTAYIESKQPEIRLLSSFCVESSTLQRIASRASGGSSISEGLYLPLSWIDFILTSANTWQRPIEDFTLIVDRGKPRSPDTQTLVSFCQPQGSHVEKIDPDHFQVHITNFIPTAELHIGYFDLPTAKPASKPPAKK